jgi:hypothetical protein
MKKETDLKGIKTKNFLETQNITVKEVHPPKSWKR